MGGAKPVPRRRAGKDYVGVLAMVGQVLLGYGVAVLACAFLGLLLDYGETGGFAGWRGAFDIGGAAAITLVLGGLLHVPQRLRPNPESNKDNVSRREAILAVVMIWFGTSFCGALPFVIGAGMSPMDAFFETVSGLTTTGATVIAQIEGQVSRPLLLWRSLIQWFGGIGIVVIFVAVFPNLRGGGKRMFGEEVPGTSAEGLKPRIRETSAILLAMYGGLTGLAALLLWAFGMTIFEAVCHAMTALSTGGFSTRDASVGAFESAPIEWSLTAFMLIGSVNYGLYYAAIREVSRGRGSHQSVRRRLQHIFRVFTRSPELKLFVVLVVVAFAILAVGHYVSMDASLEEAMRNSAFMVATTISSTGYGTHDYSTYVPYMMSVVLFLMFVGGCSGSTAGGIKVERVVIMSKVSFGEVERNYRPNLVQVVRMGAKVVSDRVIIDTMVFFFLFMGSLGLGVALVAAVDGVPVPTAFGAALSCLSNMGPAPFHLEADNFADYTAFSKFIFSLLMLLGRLEFFALLSVATRGFWKS